MKKYVGIEDMATIIPKSIRALGKDFERRYLCRYALYHWDKVVGETIAKNVKPVAVENKTLFLYAPDSTWRNQTQMMQKNLIQKFNNFSGKKIIAELRFINRPDLVKNFGKKIIVGKLLAEKVNLKKFRLTDDEKADIEKKCVSVGDDALRSKLIGLMESQKKLSLIRSDSAWHECRECRKLCPPGENLCFDCRQRKKEKKRRKIREYLTVNPWARYAEVNAFVPCEPDEVVSERVSLAQKWAAKVKLDEYDSILAKNLVMLYLCLPPKKLNEQIIAETLYRLRNDLAKPTDFKPVRRSDYIKKKKKA